MLNLTELRYLIAVSELGSFSKAAKKFFVSTPTITRAMKHLEESFGAQLFTREKNKAALNETGRLAVRCAQHVLGEAEHAIKTVQDFDRSQRTITVASCAPAPLWELTPRIAQRYPGISVSTRIMNLVETKTALRENACDIAVLPYQPSNDKFASKHLMDEALFLCVKRDHPLANRKSVTFEEINGFNFLLGSDLGFWNDVCQEKLGASRFLVQNSEFSLAEVIKSSTLPCFTTDVAIRQRYRDLGEDRVNIPIESPEAKVSFYLVTGNLEKVSKIF